MKSVVNLEQERIRSDSCKRSMETCGSGNGSGGTMADTAKCHEVARAKKQVLLQAERDFDFKRRACGDLGNCGQANQDVDKNVCMLRDVDVSNAYCISCPAAVMASLQKMDAKVTSGDEKPPSDQETSSCSRGIDNSVRFNPSKWNPTLVAISKAKCARDGNPIDLKIEHLVDPTKLKLQGPPWDKPECYDCNGAHKDLLVCLDCDGKDRNNPKCYKCNTDADKDKKFCVCAKDANNKICLDCDGADKNKPACCDVDGKDKDVDACYDCAGIHKKTKHCLCKKYPHWKICKDCAGKDQNDIACCDILGKDKLRADCYDCKFMQKDTKFCKCQANPPTDKMCMDCAGKDKDNILCCDIVGKDKHRASCYDCQN